MNLQEHWLKGQLPDVGDICFATGRVINFDENMCLASFSYSEFQTEDFGYDAQGIEIYESVVSIDKSTVHRGAGEMGNVGFIAYQNSLKEIVWSLMLDFSNPFWSMDVSTDLIVARTEIDYVFSIPIKNPEKMSCKSENPWGY